MYYVAIYIFLPAIMIILGTHLAYGALQKEKRLPGYDVVDYVMTVILVLICVAIITAVTAVTATIIIPLFYKLFYYIIYFTPLELKWAIFVSLIVGLLMLLAYRIDNG